MRVGDLLYEARLGLAYYMVEHVLGLQYKKSTVGDLMGALGLEGGYGAVNLANVHPDLVLVHAFWAAFKKDFDSVTVQEVIEHWDIAPGKDLTSFVPGWGEEHAPPSSEPPSDEEAPSPPKAVKSKPSLPSPPALPHSKSTRTSQISEEDLLAMESSSTVSYVYMSYMCAYILK